MSQTDAPSDRAESSRSQADPLPSKHGEIGYTETTTSSPTENSQDTTPTTFVPSERHPADRDYPPVSSNAIIPPAQPEIVPYPSSEQSSSTTCITKSHGILELFKPKRSPAYGGLRLVTLLIFAAQLILLGGIVVAWVLTTEHLTQLTFAGQNLFTGQPSIIFVHAIFFIIILVQLVFLERRLFRLRGERYSYLHPGQILPRHRNNVPQTGRTLAFSPWNRPPLPTYAAALAQSGVSTGDAEDHLIALSPPPAYGNTRGSTLLLSGFLRNSLGGTSNRHSGTAVQTFERDRPLSYVSRDEQWDEVQDAERARQLQETLNRLEPPSAAYIAR
jgi:hypothetical protein